MQVFISHSQEDQKLAKELSSRLSAAGVNVWLTEERVLPGENLPLEVGKALQKSDAMVVLLSPDAVESRDVRSEIAYALSSPKFEGRVIPVIVKPTKAIPWVLQTLPMIRPRGTRGPSVKRLAEKIVDALLETTKGEKVVERILGEPKVAHR